MNRLFIPWVEKDLINQLDKAESYLLRSSYVNSKSAKAAGLERTLSATNNSSMTFEEKTQAITMYWTKTLTTTYYQSLQSYNNSVNITDVFKIPQEYLRWLLRIQKTFIDRKYLDIFEYQVINNEFYQTKHHPLDKLRSLHTPYLRIVLEVMNFLEIHTKSDKRLQALLNRKTHPKSKGFISVQMKHYIILLWFLAEKVVSNIELQKQLFTLSVSQVNKVYLNVMNLYIHQVILLGKFRKRDGKQEEAFYAAALLHPIEDDYIDKSSGVSTDIIDALSIAVLGEKVSSLPDYDINAQNIFDLINTIYDAYPPSKHPLLVHTFSTLHHLQIESLGQKNRKEMSLDSILEISFLKGGYAFCFFGYISQGHLTFSEFEHFFLMGAIFQLIDDLQDTQEDSKNGIRTIFTEHLSKDGIIDKPFIALLDMFKIYERYELNGFQRPQVISHLSLHGLKQECLRISLINKDIFSPRLQKELIQFDRFAKFI